MFGNIGMPELVVIGGVALLLFGPGRLAELGRSLGKGIREFKSALSGEDEDRAPRGARRSQPRKPTADS